MTSPFDRLLDVVFYAPLGLALKAAEELPKLAAHGRERIGGQSDLARMVGRMAVAQGRRKVGDLFDRPPSTPAAADRPAADFVAPPTGGAIPVTDLRPDQPPAAAPVVAPDVTPEPTPAADTLPIPGYDSLSASQVVQRLAGLTAEELEAVRAYEQAGRGRKTVLLRVAQLRAAS